MTPLPQERGTRKQQNTHKFARTRKLPALAGFNCNADKNKVVMQQWGVSFWSDPGEDARCLAPEEALLATLRAIHNNYGRD